MREPRYNGASPPGSVTYEWFSFISFVKVWGEMAFSKALNIKKIVFEGKSKGKKVSGKKVSVRKKTSTSCVMKRQPRSAPDKKKQSGKVEVKREASVGSRWRARFLFFCWSRCNITAMWEFSRDKPSASVKGGEGADGAAAGGPQLR